MVRPVAQRAQRDGDPRGREGRALAPHHRREPAVGVLHAAKELARPAERGRELRPPPRGHERLDGDRRGVRVAPQRALIGRPPAVLALLVLEGAPRAADREGVGGEPGGAQRQDAPCRGGRAVADGAVGVLGREDIAHEVAAARRPRVEPRRARRDGRALDVAEHGLAQRAGHRVAQRCVPRAPARRPLPRGGHREGGPGRVVRIRSTAHREAAAEAVLVRGEVVQRPRERARLGGRRQDQAQRGREAGRDQGVRARTAAEWAGSHGRKSPGGYRGSQLPIRRVGRHPSAASLQEVASVRP